MSSVCPQVVIVADDLTGALDSAAAFAARGLAVVAARTPHQFGAAFRSGADVVALSTGTREVDSAAARTTLEGVRDALRGHRGILFKKVDSRLKGNVAIETAVLAKLRTAGIVVCPAVPRLGRFVQDGAVVGAGVDVPIDIAARIAPLYASIVDAESAAAIEQAVLGTLDIAISRRIEG